MSIESWREEQAKQVSANHLDYDGGVSENEVATSTPNLSAEEYKLEVDKGWIPEATSTELGVTKFDIEQYRGKEPTPVTGVVHDTGYGPEQYRYDVQTGRDTVERQSELGQEIATSLLESVNHLDEDGGVSETDVVVGGGGGAGRGGVYTRTDDAPDRVIGRAVEDVVESIPTIEDVKIGGAILVIALLLVAVIAVST